MCNRATAHKFLKIDHRRRNFIDNPRRLIAKEIRLLEEMANVKNITSSAVIALFTLEENARVRNLETINLNTLKHIYMN